MATHLPTGKGQNRVPGPEPRHVLPNRLDHTCQFGAEDWLTRSREAEDKTCDGYKALRHRERPDAPVARAHRRCVNLDQDFIVLGTGLCASTSSTTWGPP